MNASTSRTFGSTAGRIAHLGYLLLIVHVLWVTGTAAGLFVLGVGPSTAALYRALGEHRTDEHVSARDTAHTFVAAYRRTFWRANRLGLVLIAVAVVVVAAGSVVHLLPPIAALLCRAAFLCATLSIALVALMSGPAVARFGYPGSTFAMLRLALLYAVVRIPVVLLSGVVAAAVIVVAVQVPAIVVILGPNVLLLATILFERVGRPATDPKDTAAAPSALVGARGRR